MCKSLRKVEKWIITTKRDRTDIEVEENIDTVGGINN
jgi:hypothetical protein